jgi:hypothetical protein
MLQMKLRRMKWVGYVACMGDMGNAYIILVGKSDGEHTTQRI